MRKLTLYRDDSTTQVVFDNVKHFFWTANNSVLTIAQYTDAKTGMHRYIHWPRERFCWYRDEAQSDAEGAVKDLDLCRDAREEFTGNGSTEMTAQDRMRVTVSR